MGVCDSEREGAVEAVHEDDVGMIQVFKENRVLLKSMIKVQRLPVVLKAVQLDEDFQVETMEGWLKGNKSDWLVRGVFGELYPVANKVFKRTYKLLEEK
jgi:hypothetical protein